MVNGFSFSVVYFVEGESQVKGPECVEKRAGVIVGRRAGKDREATRANAGLVGGSWKAYISIEPLRSRLVRMNARLDMNEKSQIPGGSPP